METRTQPKLSELINGQTETNWVRKNGSNVYLLEVIGVILLTGNIAYGINGNDCEDVQQRFHSMTETDSGQITCHLPPGVKQSL